MRRWTSTYLSQRKSHPINLVLTLSKFYTCNETSTTFVGCCISDPCSIGYCPSSDLRSFHLANNQQTAVQWEPRPPFSNDDTDSDTSTASSSPSPTDSAAPTSTDSGTATTTVYSSPDENTGGGDPDAATAGVLVGIILGSIIAAALVGFAVFWFIRRRKRRTHQELSSRQEPSVEYKDSPGQGAPPPEYEMKGKEIPVRLEFSTRHAHKDN